jgi:hypothetical protein
MRTRTPSGSWPTTIYDPSGKNDRAPLDEVSLETLGATAVEYRQGGQWEPA